MVNPPPPGAPPDALLLRRLRQGEARAIERFWRREFPAVHRLCLGFLADASEADDAAQDAMLRLLDRLPRYDPARSFRAWRNAVVLNLCRDRRRGAGRRAAAHQRLAERPPARPPLPRPDQISERSELRELIGAALGVLPDREREAFVLRDLEGLSGAEAAAAMDITPATVRSLLSLARRRLRRELAPRLGMDSLAPEVGR